MMPCDMNYTGKGRLAAVVLGGLVLLISRAAGAQTCPTRAGVEDFGPRNQVARAVVVSGGHAYATDDYGFTVYDVSNGDAPEQVSQLILSAPGDDVAVDGSFAYVSDDSALLSVIDVSSPTDPVVVGSVRLPGRPRGIKLDPGEAVLYVACYAEVFGHPPDTLVAVDVSDPTHPEVRSRTNQYFWDHLSLRDAVMVAPGVLYTSDWGPKLKVIDVTDPGDLRLTTTLDVYCWRPVAAGGFLYGVGLQGLVVLDVSDPMAPHIVRTIDGPEYRDTLLSWGMLLATTSEGADVLDLADPTQPRVVAAIPIAEADVIAGAGTLVAVQSDRGPLQLADLTDPAHPELTGHLDVGGSAGKIVASGDLLYVDNGSSVEVVDVGDPERPVPRGRLRTSAGINLMTRRGSQLYLAISSGYLDIVDVSDPDSPWLAGSHRLEQLPFGMAVSGDYVYLGEGERLEILDVSDSTHPAQVATLPMNAEELVVDGETLYVLSWRAQEDSLLAVYDISDPTGPVFVRQLSNARITGVTPIGTYLLARDTSGRLSVLDPNLEVVATLSLQHGPGAIGVQGTMAVVTTPTSYFSPFDDSVAFVDLADPRAPRVTAIFPTLRLDNDMAIARPSSTVWTASGALVEGVWANCSSCAGTQASVSPQQIVAWGHTATVTVRVVDLAGARAPGQGVTGTVTAGRLGAFVDHGDGSYTATYTSGSKTGPVEITVSVNGETCPRRAHIDVQGLHVRQHPISAEIAESDAVRE